MEPSLKTFSKQAEQFYERGVAAAKGGQRTLAASLLRQAVKLNPQHERAWLWLGGVLDRPEDQAFCLRAALDINPDNERARQGLAHLAQRQPQADPRTTAPRPAANPLASAPPAPDPWWLRWRDAQYTWRMTQRLLWLIPSLLLITTLALRLLVINLPLPERITYRDIPTAVPVPTVAALPTPTSAPVVVDPAIITAYFESVRALQSRLRAATDSYREAAKTSRTTIERAAAARTLRTAVIQEQLQLQALVPPAGIAGAHQRYLGGLALEQQALDTLLQFYGKYDPALANRAALGLQDARDEIDAGKQGWDSFAQQFNLTQDQP